MSSQKDPRVRRTKKQIEKALLSLLETNDYEKITVSEIAGEAGLNRATFYLHYEDKEDLLEQYLTKYLEEFERKAKIVPEEFRYDSHYAHPLFIRMFEHMAENIKFYQIMLSDLSNSQIYFSIQRIISSFVQDASVYMQKDGILYDVPADLTKAYITSAYLGTILWWLENEMPYSPLEMATQLTTLSTIGPFQNNPYIKKEEPLDD